MANLPGALQASERYAALGMVPNPLRLGRNSKLPACAGWQNMTIEQGLEAVQERVRKGTLGNIGIVAGVNSGDLWQMDIDGMPGYFALLDALPQLDDTWAVLTGSKNGVHLYGRAPGYLPLTTIANEKGQHLEFRFKGQGQQCVAPPSIHPDTQEAYTTFVRKPIRDYDPATMDALIAFVEAHKPPRPADLPPLQMGVEAPSGSGAKRPYALKALDGMTAEVARLTNAKDDPQNDTMHKNVGKLAVYARHGDLSRSEVFAAMESAMRANGYIAAFGYRQFVASFESGWDYGMNESGYVPNCYQLPEPATKTWLSEEILARFAEHQRARMEGDFFDFARSLGAEVMALP